jgi:ribosomal protein S18 acetylase RimI-like enzyme
MLFGGIAFCESVAMNKILHDFTDAALRQALEANLWAYWKLFGHAPQAEVHDTPELGWVATHVPFPPFNGVVRTRLAPDQVEQVVEATLHQFRQRHVPMLWLIAPSTQPPDLARILLAQGLVHQGDDPGMAVELNRLPVTTPWPTGLTIEPVNDAATLHTWCSFTDQPAIRAALFAVGMAVGFAEDRTLYHYLGRLDGRPVAAASLVLAAGVAGLYNVMTLPDVGRRGIGTLMTTVPLRAAQARGYTMGVLQSSQMGLKLYQRLGFQQVCTVSIYLGE